jgi:ABC-type glutathione transport system ATPase component
MAESSDRPLLDIRDLSVTIDGRDGHRVHALRGVSLVAFRGTCVAVVGESGAGKSMLARAILDLLPPAASVEGQIVLDGTDLSALGPLQRRAQNGARIGLVFQEPLAALDPLFTIGEHITETLVVHRRLSRRDARKQADLLLERTGLSPGATFARTLPSRLSGGERQRALIAIAIACEPVLVVADEPTTALDPTTEHEILTLLDDARARSGATVLFITHDLALVRERADRVVVLFAGVVVEHGPVAAVLAAPRHPYTRTLKDASAAERRRDSDGEPLAVTRASTPTRAPDDGDQREPAHRPHTVVDDQDPDTGCVYRRRCVSASERCETPPPLVVITGGASGGHALLCHHPLDAPSTSTPGVT